MITTRQVNVDLTKGKLKLRHVSTKDIDAGVRVEPPKEPIKPRGVSTTTLPDVAGIAEKKRRDDIMAEAIAAKSVTKPVEEIKLDIKDEKKIVTAEKKVKPVIKAMKTDEEKKIAIAERMAKVRAAKAKKKKEGN